MWVPLAILALLSIGGGYLLHEPLKGWLYPHGISVLSNEIAGGHPHHGLMAGENLMYASIAAAVTGMLLGLLVYWRGMPKRERDTKTMFALQRAAGDQFGYDRFVVQASVEGGETLADKIFFKGVDVGVVDGLVNGIGVFSRSLGSVFKKFQSGFVRSYALLMLLGVVGILTSLFLQLMHGGAK